jgi:universal stress protein E
MVSIHKILVVIDPTVAEQPALERIAHWPRPLDAQLKLVICDYNPQLNIEQELSPAVFESVCKSIVLRHRQRLEELAAPLRAEGLRVVTEVAWDYPLHEAIVRQAADWNADLVVKDTHYHSALRRAIFSNTDWSLIRTCPCLLLLVKPRPTGHVPCVVAAVDPLHPHAEAASLDHLILDSAKLLTQLVGGQTHVLHSFDVIPLVTSSAEAMVMPIALDLQGIVSEMRKNHTEVVRALAGEHEIPPERVHVVEGTVQQVLVSATDELHADLLVTGAVSRRFLERLVLGSTAEAVLDKISCDLLIVKPEFERGTPNEEPTR